MNQDESKILAESDKVYFSLLNEMQVFHHLPKVLSLTETFRDVSINGPQDAQALDNIRKNYLGEYAPKIISKKGKTKIEKGFKPHTLLLAYMNGAPLSGEYKVIVDTMLKIVPSIMDRWVGISLNIHELYSNKRIRKNMTPRAIVLILEFSQHLMQGLWKDTHPLYQIPCMTEDMVKKLKKAMKKKPELNDLLNMTDDQRLDLNVFTATELIQVNAVCKHIPNVTVEVTVDNPEEIAYMDFAVFRVKITRHNLKENQEQDFIHSQAYPFLRKEILYCFLTEDVTEQHILGFTKIEGQGHVEEQEIKVRIGMVGTLSLALFVQSDSYIQGTPIRKEITITALAREKLPDQYTYFEEDLKHVPTLFEQAMKGVQDDTSDEDIEDEHGNVIKEKKESIGSDEELSEED